VEPGEKRGGGPWAAFDRTVEAMVGSLFAILVLLACLQILLRYVFNMALEWSDEVIRYLFIWIVALAAPLATLHGDHFLVSIVPDALPRAGRRALARAVLVVTILFLLALVWLGVRFTAAMQGRVSSVLELPMPLIYASVPVAGVLMLANMVRLARRAWAAGGPEGQP
jgi:TRAP-type C4-dicarboxylate transport system permease small subunit